MFRKLGMVALVVGISAGAANAQVMKRKIDLGNIKTMPVIRQVEVDLDRIPEAWIHFDRAQPQNGPQWAITRSPKPKGGGIQPEVKGVWAQGFLISQDINTPCQSLIARIDLAQLRANGFRLSGYDYETPPPRPAAYSENQTGAHRPSDTPLSQRTEVVASGQTYAIPRSGKIRMCWSGFHVRLKVRGPEGVDPVTGRKRVPSRPPN